MQRLLECKVGVSEQDGDSEHCAALRLYSKEQFLTVSVNTLTLVLTACIQKRKLFYCAQAKRGALFGNPILFGNPLPYLVTPNNEQIEAVLGRRVERELVRMASSYSYRALVATLCVDRISPIACI